MDEYLQHYDPRRIYDHESSGRDPLPGRSEHEGQIPLDFEILEVNADIRKRSGYLSPYRMDHIAELHSDRASARKVDKTLFPREWSDDEIFGHIQTIVSAVTSKWSRDQVTGGRPNTLFNPWHDREDIEFEIPARFRVDGYIEVTGSRTDIMVRVIVEPYGEGIITAYPLIDSLVPL